MRAMSQTSIDNYIGLVKPKLTEREKWVLDAIEEIAPCSAEMVARHLNVPINIISGRMTGLKNKEKITKSYRGINDRGAKVDFWQPSEMEREENDSF